MKKNLQSICSYNLYVSDFVFEQVANHLAAQCLDGNGFKEFFVTFGYQIVAGGVDVGALKTKVIWHHAVAVKELVFKRIGILLRDKFDGRCTVFGEVAKFHSESLVVEGFVYLETKFYELVCRRLDVLDDVADVMEFQVLQHSVRIFRSEFLTDPTCLLRGLRRGEDPQG